MTRERPHVIHLGTAGTVALSMYAAIVLVLASTGCGDRARERPAEGTSSASTGGDLSGRNDRPVTGGTLVTAVSADPKTLDPAVISSWDQSAIAANLVEGLFRLSPDGHAIEPALAEACHASAGGKTWRCTLRTEAKFHNGRPVVASDVKYSFERVLRPATKSPRAWMLAKIDGANDFQEGRTADVRGIKVVDQHTLEITLIEPLAPFKAMLASVSLAVVPREEVERWKEDFGQHVVSAGPFKLGTWALNQEVTLDAFDGYWAGRPYLDAVKFRAFQDENTRIVEFDAGTLDVSWVPPAHWARFSGDPGLRSRLGRAETFHTDFLAINLERPPFGTNPALRRAMRYALDLDAVVSSVQGRATVAHGILPPGIVGYQEGAELYYPRNLDKARTLMKEAGFERGVPGVFEVILPPWGNLLKIMEIYQANLKEIGINLSIRAMPAGAYTEALDTGTYTLAWVYRVTDYADPDGFYFALLDSQNVGGGGNCARYRNARCDDNIRAARTALDGEERIRRYRAVDEQFARDMPYIPLTHNIYVDVSQPEVRNYRPSPMDTHMFHRVWLLKPSS